MDQKKTGTRICLCIGLLALQAGCSDQGKVRSYSEIVPESEKAPRPVQNTTAPAGATLHWHSPAGWQSGPASDMRLASFQIDDETLCTIVALPGTGGDIESNIVRWARQIGRTDLGEADLKTLTDEIELRTAKDGIIFKVVDLTPLTPSGISIIGSIANLPDKTLFVKLSGPTDRIKALKGPYFELLESFHFMPSAKPNEGQDQQLQGGSPVARSAPPLVWSVPDTWREFPGSGIRLATFRPELEDGSECYITVMAGDVGGLERNVQWWANQIGLTLEGNQLESFQAEMATAEVDGAFYRLVDYTSLAPEPESETMIVAVARLPASTVFVKMNGTRKAVAKQRKAFMALVNSLRHN